MVLNAKPRVPRDRWNMNDDEGIDTWKVA
jgi:hypothetical protein